MKNKINAVLSLGVCAFAILSVSFCTVALAEPAAQPSVQIGVVAQRFPWNGTVDVNVKVAGVTAEAGATLTVTATVGGEDNKLVVATVTGVKDGERTVSFNANDFDALKGKQLKDVKITAKVE